MESPEQWVFAYQHNVIDVGMTDTVGGLDHCKVVGLTHSEYSVSHYSQRSVAQTPGTPVETEVVGIAPSMVVKPCFVVQH